MYYKFNDDAGQRALYDAFVFLQHQGSIQWSNGVTLWCPLGCSIKAGIPRAFSSQVSVTLDGCPNHSDTKRNELWSSSGA